MKKSVINEAHRILDLMGRVTLTELNVKYMDQLLDKVSASGMESLSDYEKMALGKLSRDEDVNPPEIHSLDMSKDTLRLTAADIGTGQPLVRPENAGETFGESEFQDAYLHGRAEELAVINQPIFIDGDLSQLDKPEHQQEIRLLLPQGEYECIARKVDEEGNIVYYIMIKPEEEDPNEDDDLVGLNERGMLEYKVFDSGEMNEPLDMTEGNAFVGAAKKAKEEGKDSFELNGKTYKVTVTTKE